MTGSKVWRGLAAGLLGVMSLAGPVGAMVSPRAGGAMMASAGQTAEKNGQRQTSTPYKGDLGIFEYPDRDKKLQINRVMDLLGIQQNKIVVDIGAGSGWFTVRAARRVGPGGRVFAEDINPDAVEHIAERAKKENVDNVRVILGTVDDPRLQPGAADAVLLLKVYHEIAQPIPFMKAVKKGLRAGAKVGIIDRNGNGSDHGLNRDVMEREMAEAGYKVVGRYDFTKADGQDYFVVFE